LYTIEYTNRMHYPDFGNYNGLMTYETYKAWITGFYEHGTPLRAPLEWRHAITAYYANKPSRNVWEAHVEQGGSHWTLFDDKGWQMAPGNIKSWKNRIQLKTRRNIRKDQIEMNLHRADIRSDTDSSTSTPEEEYWKDV